MLHGGSPFSPARHEQPPEPAGAPAAKGATHVCVSAAHWLGYAHSWIEEQRDLHDVPSHL
jgi:hypothetical protein